MARQLAPCCTTAASPGRCAARGLRTIASRHTCGHRVDELMRIVESLRAAAPRARWCRSPDDRPTMAFFGSSLLSSYWNGAATYYRGIIRALHDRGRAVTFYEPDAYERQAHRDIPPPDWARSWSTARRIRA